MAQLVRAPPCHGGGRGFESLLGRLSCMLNEISWALSSAGRASALQAEGHRFEPCSAHFIVKDKNILPFTIIPPGDAHGFAEQADYKSAAHIFYTPMWLNS